MGIGPAGRLAQLEGRMHEHEKIVQRFERNAAAFGTLLTIATSPSTFHRKAMIRKEHDKPKTTVILASVASSSWLCSVVILAQHFENRHSGAALVNRHSGAAKSPYLYLHRNIIEQHTVGLA